MENTESTDETLFATKPTKSTKVMRREICLSGLGVVTLDPSVFSVAGFSP
jgi:hypothetical protein